ncbi:hypothetical protein D9757_003319 [Collybiopsis confluens]|uniref:Phenylalanine ammonia-lyase n=1 Tax=Collybiopsis confluens TaxID=2823264 RepID=A0A8H5HZ05_9AGAR|nr:hypothetical protein D9757_003319 [Collybiopsis confluens]
MPIRTAVPQLSNDDEVISRVNRSCAAVHDYINRGRSLYGVTTGVGASAATRTTKVEELQNALVSVNLNGILPTFSSSDMRTVLDEDFMKGTLMVRLNSLTRGHSGVRWAVIEAIHKLLVHDVVPLASKNSTVRPGRSIRPVAEVLREIQLEPLTYGPKEAIAIVNGTAASASAAALVLYDANVLLLATQALTVLSMEALRANLEPFRPFPHVDARPHPGQIEMAANVVRMAEGSKFVVREYPEGDPEFLMRQDRYHIRCSPQWLGPFAESLLRATESVNIELNSTTDNPIIDPDADASSNNIYHAGNFQALAPAEAMDAVRHAILGMGKILYAQHSELLNPVLNRGLPTDCAAGEPNIDYGLKANDMACSAYLSEIGFLSGSFLPHINSTEHHVQSINSMALASARHARDSLIATYLYTVCQAIDLREMNTRYLARAKVLFEAELPAILECPDHTTAQDLASSLFTVVRVQFGRTATMESLSRFKAMLAPLITELYTRTASDTRIGLVSSTTPVEWVQKLEDKLRENFLESRMEYFREGHTGALDSLGHAGRRIYDFIRRELGIPMKKGVDGLDEHEIGTWISVIYEALQDGKMDRVFVDAVTGN